MPTRVVCCVLGMLLLVGGLRADPPAPGDDKDKALEQEVRRLLDLNAALEQKVKAVQQREAVARKRAEEQRAEAEAQRAKAEEQLKRAEEEQRLAQKLAEDLRLRAEVERDKAQKQAQVAEAQRLNALKEAQARSEALALQLKEAQVREAEQRAEAERAAAKALAEAERARQEATKFREQAERALRDAETRTAPKADLEATKKYQKAVAEHFLQAVLARNGRGLGGTLSKELQSSIGEGQVQTWVAELHPKQANYREARFDPEQTSPGGEETVFTGVLGGTSFGRFSVRVVKDKESGRFVIDSASVVEMPR
jgi:hypothetical protein